MSRTVLSQRALQRAVLGRQQLLERSEASIAGTLRAIGGLQAQYAPSMYLGLWSRMDGFPRRDLTAALEVREVVQATLQRVTIHLVDLRDYWPFALAVRTPRRRLWLRSYPQQSEAELVAAAEKVRAALTDGPRTRKQIEELVGKPLVNGVGLWVDLLRVPPSGTWEHRRADLYADAERELGPPPPIDEGDARAHLVLRYLAGFGPATKADVVSYTGLSPPEVTAVLADLELRRFEDEDGRELVDVPDGLLPDEDAPAAVRFLPTWDATLLVHCRRTGILPERFRARIFSSKTPHSFPTFTVDGAVAGTWRHTDAGIQLDPFEPLPSAVREELEAEAALLAAFHE